MLVGLSMNNFSCVLSTPVHLNDIIEECRLGPSTNVFGKCVCLSGINLLLILEHSVHIRFFTLYPSMREASLCSGSLFLLGTGRSLIVSTRYSSEHFVDAATFLACLMHLVLILHCPVWAGERCTRYRDHALRCHEFRAEFRARSADQ